MRTLSWTLDSQQMLQRDAFQTEFLEKYSNSISKQLSFHNSSHYCCLNVTYLFIFKEHFQIWTQAPVVLNVLLKRNGGIKFTLINKYFRKTSQFHILSNHNNIDLL